MTEASLLLIFLGGAAMIPVTWGFYLSVMHLKAARDAGMLTPAAKALGYPWLAVGLVVDAVFNAVIGTVLFVEPPREVLFTSRVSRHACGAGWRARLARWICSELLDPFDPAGRHCK
jgi:hypothetical protein